jgi:hypothetical protein
MIETPASERQLTLPTLLAARARAASDGRLALTAAGGLIVASLVLTVRPPAWPLLLPVATWFLAYGAWGIADRALHERPPDAGGVQALRGLRASAVVLGVSSVLAVGAVIMGFVLGNWIH